MATVWFVLSAIMLIGYVVLDGFDLGAGALHLIAARTEDERRLVLQSIGPVWDGNEVWLLAAGGTLFYAFPLLYASSFSGFYLALHMVLWLLVFRAIGIEFRLHAESQIWRDFFDGMFSLASLLLIVLFGAALGNVIRGVPIGPDQYFFLPLWTNFLPGPNPGALDWYTILCALITVAAVAIHGALWVAWKTEGALNARMRRIASAGIPALAVLTVAALAATMLVRPQILDNYKADPVGWAIPLLVTAGLTGMWRFNSRSRERNAFFCSCLYMVAMLAGAAFALYPVLLPSSLNPAGSLTIQNAASGANSLSIGLWWWGAGMAIALGYFVLVYTMFRGKVSPSGGHG
jgi:cytochrome bd ubiquinol oxidase subunit II